MSETLTLKWGTLKGWDLKTEKSKTALKKYFEDDVQLGAMQQRDTENQKNALCELIDVIEGTIYLDWDGKYVTKEEAKAYIMNYGK